MKILLAIFFCTISACLYSQAPDIVWQKSIGGVKDDYAYAIDVTTDSGLIAAGISFSNEGDVSGHHGTQYFTDLWVAKLDAIGNLIWQRSLGGLEDDGAHSVLQTSEGGYLVAGFSQSNSGDVTGHIGEIGYNDCWVVKLSADGTMEWQRSLGGTSTDYVHTILETPDGGYIFIGDSYSNDYDVSGNHGKSDIWVVKLDSTGDIEWQNSYGGSENEYASSIAQTVDGGYIFSAFAYSNNGDIDLHYGSYMSADTWIVKLNAIGEIEWQKIYGGTYSEYTEDIIQTADGGYIFIADAQSEDYDLDMHHGDTFYPDLWVVKITNSGEIEWQKIIGGDSYDRGFTIKQTTDLHYIISGETSSVDGDVFGNLGSSDIWMVKISSVGELLWQKCFGGSSSDYRGNIDIINDSSFVFSGFSYSDDLDVSGNNGGWDFWVGKMGPCTSELYYADADEDGYGNLSMHIFSCEMPIGYVADSTDCDDTNDMINPGAEEIVNGLDDNCDENIDEGVSITTEFFADIKIFPNPAEELLFIEPMFTDLFDITVYNLEGKLMLYFQKLQNNNTINISTLESGLYILKMESPYTFENYKFLKQ